MAKHTIHKAAERLNGEHSPNMVKPEILCIGPTKTGTSWLYTNLRRHPQIWVPPIKELHFLVQPRSHRFINARNIKNALFSSQSPYRDTRVSIRKKVQRSFLSSSGDTLFDFEMRWLLNFALGQRSYKWYSGLFPVTPKLCADISPLSYKLQEEKIRNHQAYNPQTKIIIIVRNPIDRVWSHARMQLCRNHGRRVDQVDYAEFIAIFDETYKYWVPYLQTIALWQSYFDDVYVTFYDRLAADPTAFFAEICTFLDIQKDIQIENLEEPVYQGVAGELSLEFRRYLYDQYAPEMIDMADSGIDYAKKWLDEHNEIIKRGNYQT